MRKQKSNLQINLFAVAARALWKTRRLMYNTLDATLAEKM
jgi:hypothetical protein